MGARTSGFHRSGARRHATIQRPAAATALIGTGNTDIVAITVGTDAYVFIDNGGTNSIGVAIKLTGVAASNLVATQFI